MSTPNWLESLSDSFPIPAATAPFVFACLSLLSVRMAEHAVRHRTSSPCQGHVRYVQAPSLCRLSLAERGLTPSWRGATAGADIAVTAILVPAVMLFVAFGRRYGISKSEILDSESAGVSLAVRLAQGETHMVAQTKEWLASSGISAEVLQI